MRLKPCSKAVAALLALGLAGLAPGGLMAQAASASLPSDPPAQGLSQGGGAWLSLDSGAFRYVYQEVDSDYVRRLQSIQEGVRQTVAGYLGYLPAGQLTVIVRSNRQNLSFAGYFSTFPPRIVLNSAVNMDPFELFVHEFTHYTQAWHSASLASALSDIFGSSLRNANLVQAGHSVEGSTSWLDASRGSPWDLALVRGLLHGERGLSWEDAAWASWAFPWNYRIYLGGWLWQKALYDHYGPQAYRRIWDLQMRQGLLEDQAVRRLYGDDAALVWEDMLKDLRRQWAGDFALADGQRLGVRDRLDQPQVYRAKDLGDGRLALQTGSTQSPGGLSLYQVDRGSTQVLQTLDNGFGPGEWDILEGGSLLVWLKSLPVRSDSETDGDRPRIFWQTFDPQGRNQASGCLEEDPVPAAATGPWASPGRADGNWQAGFDPASLQGRFGTGQAQAGVWQNLQAFCGVWLRLDPASPRLWGIHQQGFRFSLAEIDPFGRRFRLYTGLPDLKEVEASPDGRWLAAIVSRGLKEDPVVLDLQTLEWQALSADESLEAKVGFAPEGSLVFASDRRNRVEVFAWDHQGFSPLVADPVMARRPVHWSGLAEDGSRHVMYESLDADGFCLKTRPLDQSRTPLGDYHDIQAQWTEFRSFLRQEYMAGGQEILDQAAIPGLAQDALQASSPEPLLDLAGPDLWYPLVQLSSLGFGVAVQGDSYLGENSWLAQAMYWPLEGQVQVDWQETLDFPGLGISLEAGNDLLQWLDSASTSGLTTRYRWLASLGIWGRLAGDYHQGGLGHLDAGIWADLRFYRDSSDLGDVSQFFQGDWQTQILPGAWLDFSWQAQSARGQYFGSNALEVKVQGSLDPLGADLPWYIWAVLGAQADLGRGTVLGLQLQGAFGASVNAFGVLDVWSETWRTSASSDLGLRLALVLGQSLELWQATRGLVHDDSGGTRLGLASSLYRDREGQIQWDGQMELMVWYCQNLVYSYMSWPLEIGLGYKLDLLSENLEWNWDNLGIWLSLAGKRLDTGISRRVRGSERNRLALP